MFYVFTDSVTAGVECCQFFVCKRKLNNLLNAVCTDDAGDTRKEPGLPVFAAKLGTGGHNDLFIMQYNVRHACGSCRNAMLSAFFAGEGYPAAVD